MTQQYRSRKEIYRKKPKKKNWLFFLPIIVLFIVGSGYVINSLLSDLNPEHKDAYAHTPLKLSSERKQAKRSLLKELADKQWQESKNYSTDEQTFFVDNLKHEDSLGLLFSHFPKDNAPDIVTGKQVSENYSKSLTRVYYNFSSYIWNEKKKSYDQTESNSGEASFIRSDTKKMPTTTDFFPSNEELMRCHFLIQQEILNRSKDGNTIIDEVLNLAPFKTGDLVVNKVNDVGIEVTLSQPIGDVSMVMLPWAEFSHYLNSSFVSKQYFPEHKNKQVALTFDDGPRPETTEKLLKILKEEDVPATFFVLGSQAEAYPNVLKEIIEDGHTIGNHSYDHKNLTQLTPDAIKTQMHSTDKTVYKATGLLPKYIRPPYGAMKESIAKTLDQPLIHWNVDTEDWKKGSSEKIVKTVNDQLEDGSVILLHDIHENSVDAVRPIIQSLKKQGYEFTTVDTIFKGPKSHTQYFGGSREINEF
ncbi:peptidoglycan-N-acetylglucosamine deacetylase [Enterococcus sp. AZ194]|uniref:polysaccharide deacetylase family protein n=1 Tax=Enterococcus sp. AZ194 TaxID=2774629 RepID=UPI003F221971